MIMKLGSAKLPAITRNDWCRKRKLVPVKRETGERPVRTRHCMQSSRSDRRNPEPLRNAGRRMWQMEDVKKPSKAVSQETCQLSGLEKPRVTGLQSNKAASV